MTDEGFFWKTTKKLFDLKTVCRSARPEMLTSFSTGWILVVQAGSVEKTRRACAGAPGLRSRSYFGGVGSAGSQRSLTQ
jgi:hypothetical protein